MLRFNDPNSLFNRDTFAACTTLTLAAVEGDEKIAVAKPEIFGARGVLQIGEVAHDYGVLGGVVMITPPLARAHGAGTVIAVVEAH